MVWGKKKAKKVEEEDELPMGAEEEDEATKGDYNAKIKELDARIAKLDKKAGKAIEKNQEQGGEFNLNEEEMALAVNALANSEEFKIYRQMIVGQKIAEIIGSYNKVIGERVGSSKEEQLPSE